MRRRLVWVWAFVPLWAIAQTQTAEDHSAALNDIAAQRARVQSEFDGQAAACYERFAVNACLKKVERQRTAALKTLGQQENQLHDAQRKQQASEQLQRLDQKAKDKVQADAQAQRNALERQQAQADKLQAQKDKRAELVSKQSVSGAPEPRETSAPTPSEQAQNRENYARKLADAEKKRQDIAKQKSERTGKPLPLPE